MKKIDFHIHTKKSISDKEFEFDIEKLKEYVEIAKLDAIAITNHNLFDKNQFDEIKENLGIKVFPGVEVNLENGHILLIADEEYEEELERLCSQLSNYIIEQGDTLSYDVFQGIFSDLSNFIVIPHYKKDPVLDTDTLNKLTDNIIVGEVSSPKKWERMYKDKNEKLNPVLFSDVRIDKNIKSFPVKQTYIDCDELTVPKIKLVFADKNKIAISMSEDISQFQILHDGTNASTGLNIVLGKRSSGKTYTLNAISNTFENDRIRYIKQFELVKNSEEIKFNEIIKKNQSEFIENYLKEFKWIVNDIRKIDTDENVNEIEEYLRTLKNFAGDTDKMDIYSKTKLFNEAKFSMPNINSIENVLKNTRGLLENEEYKDLIKDNLGKEKLKELYLKAFEIYKKLIVDRKLKEKINTLIEKTQKELGEKSSVAQIEQCDFKKILKQNNKIKSFEDIVRHLKIKEKVNEEIHHKFKIQTYKGEMKNATDVKTRIGFSGSIVGAFGKYDKPYEYLKLLEEIGVNESILYKAFCTIDFEVKNDKGNNISGGEKAEYNLLEELIDAYKYDMLLIDEPESSFDNIFLKENIIKCIKDLSLKTTIFLVTHNNTLGMLMNPDCIIYTENKDNVFSVYTGKMTSEVFTSVSGDTVSSYEVLMDTMEAGIDAYNERRNIYDAIKSRK